MFGATIDVYHEEISAALARGDNAGLCVIAQAFCERCHYWKPWKITNVRSHICPVDGLKVFVSIAFEDGSAAEVFVGYQNNKRRLTVNGDRICCDSSADVVHSLEVPCAFFDGIYFAVEGLERIARGELVQQIARLDKDAKAARAAAEAQWANIDFAEKLLRQTQKQREEEELRLSKAVENRRLAGTQRTWTLAPVDFSSRILDAHSMVALCNPEFVSLREAKAKLSGKSGVYFGWRVSDGMCVYVGKSENLGKRLHPRREELHDCKVTYIEMPPEDIHTWELFFIWLHQPERNKEVRESNASKSKICRVADQTEKEVA